MPTLIKIHDETCDICKELEGYDSEIARLADFEFKSYTLEELAGAASTIQDYVVHYYVLPNDGMITVPIYLIEAAPGQVQASSIVTKLEEVLNLINAWKQWESSQSAKSAE